MNSIADDQISDGKKNSFNINFNTSKLQEQYSQLPKSQLVKSPTFKKDGSAQLKLNFRELNQMSNIKMKEALKRYKIKESNIAMDKE